uniref:Uncharacterized protein n=1 Tax=Arundo donax TaxID=35708 RepID=A0A0A9E4J6_ARUDO
MVLAEKKIQHPDNVVLIIRIKFLVQHAQQRDLHDSLLVKGRLVFYNLHCNIIVGFCIPAFCNLSEGTLPKHFLDNIPPA